MENRILITDCTIIPVSGRHPRIIHGGIGIEGRNIVMVGGSSDDCAAFRDPAQGPCTVIDGSGMLAMPGLVNTHNHISMSLMRGYADDMPLMKWLNDYIWPFEARLTRNDILAGARLGIAEMLLGGTTTSADMYWHEEAVGQAAQEAGMRLVVAPTFTDAKYPDFETDLEMVTEKYGPGRNSLVSMMIAPHSVYTCCEQNLRQAKKYADDLGVGMAIHVSETLDEQEMIRQRFAMTPVELLENYGMLDERTLAVHVVHVNDRDIEIMARHGVCTAHNPQSNMKLSSGVAPVAKLLEAGVRVTIGTDGPCSNNDLDMWDEIRSASFLQKVATGNPCILPAYELLEMATAGGADALGLGRLTGRLEEGMRADLILLDVNKPHLVPHNDLIANLVYCAKSSDVDTVIVDGQVVVRSGNLLTLDTGQVCRDAQLVTKSVKEKLQ